MSKPIWITPAGSLGVVPEGIFYQQALRADVAALSNSPTCTATSGTTNLITCSTTEGIYPGLEVVFFGTSFGGIEENRRYFVRSVPDSTHFSICDTEDVTLLPISLTTATGIMTAYFKQHTYYTLIAGKLPPGIQCADNGLLIGVPKAVASLQGVPFDVGRDVTSKFVIRGYTKTQSGAIDGIADQTFSLTITGNDIPEFITPAGSIGQYYDSSFVNIQLEYTGLDPDEVVEITLASGELPGGLTLSRTGLIQGWAEPIPDVNAVAGYDLTPNSLDPYDFSIISTSKNFQFTCKISDGKAATLRTFYIYIYNRSDLSADDTYLTADNTFVTADETPTRPPFLYNSVITDLGRVRSDNYYAYQFVGGLYGGDEQIGYTISVNEGFGLPPGLQLDPVTGWYYGFIPDQGTTEITYSFNIQVYQISDPTNVSPLYPFTITITGAIDAEVKWLTPPEAAGYTRVLTKKYDEDLDTFVSNSVFVYDLGTIDNGSTSMFYVEAENRGGRSLQYRLKGGAYNELPQGLELLPTGEIIGRVSFDTFALDGGTTTFDKTLAVTRNVDALETTFDLVFVFTVNAYAEDPGQLLYKVSSVRVDNGGIGYSDINLPTMEFSTPIGASAVQAQVGTIVVEGGAITSVAVANSGAGYSSPATLTITQGFGGSDAVLTPVMIPTGTRDVISVYRTFSIRVNRAYNKPYQNLYIEAMPPENDRVVIGELLTNTEIFVPDYIYRLQDPNFGIARRVTYQHAFGLAPETFDKYVESLYLNHYWKDLVLGPVKTAQAIDPVTNEVIYEVVYSEIVDDLVNSQNQSVSKIVNLPYAIVDPLDENRQIAQVYPNSLDNMRDQVIQVVGQISKKLPLWMTSKQADGATLGFRPAWVMCYAKPGRSKQIAYYFSKYFENQLNAVNFKVDRYVLDRVLSKNWNADTQKWNPTPPTLTTFDRFNNGSTNFIGQVSCATNLAFADVNNRTVDYINGLGGIDGQTWVAIPGRTPPPGTKVVIRDGSTIVFAKQENYGGPPGSYYPTTDAAWQYYNSTYDQNLYDQGTPYPEELFDQAITLSGGNLVSCTDTTAIANTITCSTTGDLNLGQPVSFTGTTFGGIATGTTYYVREIVDGTKFTVSLTVGGSEVTLTTAAGTMVCKPIDLRMAVFTINITTEGIVQLTLTTNTVANDLIQITQGSQYFAAQLYYPTSPGTGLTRVSWLPFQTVNSNTGETIFDGGSMQFIDPVDMYDASQNYDKYLVFPKSNILA